jgi:hypothetical protein
MSFHFVIMLTVGTLFPGQPSTQRLLVIRMPQVGWKHGGPLPSQHVGKAFPFVVLFSV